MDRENPTVQEVAAYLAAHPMVTANRFGPTGRAARATWIDRDGTGWTVWDTDERGVEIDSMTLCTASESEALDAFLRRAEHHRDADATVTRRS
jgi:hypothetical protein